MSSVVGGHDPYFLRAEMSKEPGQRHADSNIIFYEHNVLLK